MSEPTGEFPFDENLRKLKDDHRRKLEKLSSLQHTFSAKTNGTQLAGLDEGKDFIAVAKKIKDMEKQLDGLMDEVARKREAALKLKAEQDSLTEAMDEAKAEMKRLKQEITPLKQLSPLLDCYDYAFDVDSKIDMISEEVYKVSMRFTTNSEMARVVVVLNLPNKQILSSTDDGDIPLANYTKKLGKYFLYLRTKYAEK